MERAFGAIGSPIHTPLTIPGIWEEGRACLRSCVDGQLDRLARERGAPDKAPHSPAPPVPRGEFGGSFWAVPLPLPLPRLSDARE